jgi:hypothetical protein
LEGMLPKQKSREKLPGLQGRTGEQQGAKEAGCRDHGTHGQRKIAVSRGRSVPELRQKAPTGRAQALGAGIPLGPYRLPTEGRGACPRAPLPGESNFGALGQLRDPP